MTDKVTHYDYYYKAIPRTAFDKRAVKKTTRGGRGSKIADFETT